MRSEESTVAPPHIFPLHYIPLHGKKQDNSENIFVDEILHETKVSVDEKKKKAVAVTFSMVKSAGPSSKFFFNADHPFCYIIKDNSNNLILFTGVVNNPNE